MLLEVIKCAIQILWLDFLKIAVAILILYLVIKGIGKLINLYVDRFPERRAIGEWIKRVLFICAALPFLIGGYDRWHHYHDEISYGKKKLLNPGYANQVETEVYLMSDKDVADLFEGKPPHHDMLDIPEHTFNHPSPYLTPKPSDPRFFLVIRLKNKGDQVTWGILDYFIDGKQSRQINIPPLPPHMDEYKNVVLLANYILPGPYPTLEAKWQQLYTMQGVKQ
jgi:hypothetical protein